MRRPSDVFLGRADGALFHSGKKPCSTRGGGALRVPGVGGRIVIGQGPVPVRRGTGGARMRSPRICAGGRQWRRATGDRTPNGLSPGRGRGGGAPEDDGPGGGAGPGTRIG